MIGISIGSQSTVVGVLKNSNVEIILSETSSRGVPTISSFSDRQRYFGDQALSTIKSNYNRTVQYPNRWLGMQPDWPYLKEEAKFSTIQPTVDKHNKVGFEIGYKGEQEVYYPEHIMGLFFNKLKQNWKKAGYDTKEVVVSVPDYYNAYERKAMVDSLSIADLNCISLINESSAIAMNYGLFRRNQFEDNKARIVAFVDMGQSKTTISFASFTKNYQKVVSVTSERFLGAREFDYLLMEHFSGVFKKKFGCNPMNSAKCRLRMIDAIAKTRKILTSNKEATLSVESLMEEEDLLHNLTRDEFEQIIAPVLEKFRNLMRAALTNALNEAKINQSDIFAVEMVGDAVRTPIIQQIVKETFGMELSKTLLPDECIARGCTLFAAMSSPYFSLKDFTFEHYNPFSVVLEYPFLKDGQIQIRTHTIIKKGENFPSRKSIKFNEKQVPKQDVVQMRLFYNNEEIPFIHNNLLKTYMVSLPHVKEETWTFVLQFYLDANGLPHLDKASINEVYYEDAPSTTKTAATTENKTADGKAGEGNVEAKPEEKKVEKVKKERSTLGIIKLVESIYGLSQTDLDNITQKEANQENEDRILTLAINKRNEIENFIYSTREKLRGDLAEYVNSSETESLVDLMQKMEDWLYSGDENVYVKSILEDKAKSLNDLGTKIYKRYHDWERLKESLFKFNRNFNELVKKANDFNQTMNLSQIEKEELSKLLTELSNFYNLTENQVNTLPKISDAPQKYEDVDKKIADAEKRIKQLIADANKRAKDEADKKAKEAQAQQNKPTQQAEQNVNMTDNQSIPENKDTKSSDLNMDVD